MHALIDKRAWKNSCVYNVSQYPVLMKGESFMDVDPPESGIHSWRDFFVHMGTIVLGLLIAIGLEQSVEKLHHLDERHQLEADLRDEGTRDQWVVEEDLKAYAKDRVWLLALRQDVDTMRASAGKIKLPFRPQPIFTTPSLPSD